MVADEGEPAYSKWFVLLSFVAIFLITTVTATSLFAETQALARWGLRTFGSMLITWGSHRRVRSSTTPTRRMQSFCSGSSWFQNALSRSLRPPHPLYCDGNSWRLALSFTLYWAALRVA